MQMQPFLAQTCTTKTKKPFRSLAQGPKRAYAKRKEDETKIGLMKQIAHTMAAEAAAEKEQQKKTAKEKEERRKEREKMGEQVQVIKNTKKLKRMSRKQLRLIAKR